MMRMLCSSKEGRNREGTSKGKQPEGGNDKDREGQSREHERGLMLSPTFQQDAGHVQEEIEMPSQGNKRGNDQWREDH